MLNWSNRFCPHCKQEGKLVPNNLTMYYCNGRKKCGVLLFENGIIRCASKKIWDKHNLAGCNFHKDNQCLLRNLKLKKMNVVACKEHTSSKPINLANF
jgi:hypothetical protein